MKKVFLIMCLCTSCIACAPQRVTVYCEPQHAGIYVDGVYQGNGLIEYTIPRGTKRLEISCSEDGVSFVKRSFATRGISSTISIYLRDYMHYSSETKALTTH